MPAPTEDMDTDPDKRRLQMISTLLVQFVGPLPDKSHCHICLDSWHPASPPNGEDDEILCKDPVRIDHPTCQCRNIVIGRSCITSWLTEKETCPMCRSDIFDLPPIHLRNRQSHQPHDEESPDSDNEGVDSDYAEDEYVDEEFEGQSWLFSNGNFIHGASISTGEHFDANDIVMLFLNKDEIDVLKTAEEKAEYYNSKGGFHGGGHVAASWDMAYQELVSGRPQKLEDIFTVHGKVTIEGIEVESW